MKIETTKKIKGKDIVFTATIGEPQATEHKWWADATLYVDGEEVTGKGTSEPKMAWNPAEKKSVFCISLDGEKAAKVAGLYGKRPSGYVYLTFPGQGNVYEELRRKGEKLVADIRKEATEKEENEMNKLFKENTILKLRDHSSYGFSCYEYERSTRGKKIFSKIGEINKGKLRKALQNYVKGSDWGDYSITTFYEIPMLELETIVEELHKTAIEEEKARRKAEQERKESLMAKAKELGHRVEYSRHVEPCDGSDEECDIDHVIEYIDGNGVFSYERIHTY